MQKDMLLGKGINTNVSNKENLADLKYMY